MRSHLLVGRTREQNAAIRAMEPPRWGDPGECIEDQLDALLAGRSPEEVVVISHAATGDGVGASVLVVLRD